MGAYNEALTADKFSFNSNGKGTLITGDITAPKENEEVPKAVYNLTGTITSANILSKVEAYLDDSAEPYAVVESINSTTLSLLILTSFLNLRICPQVNIL